jgi:hypothetical protein
MRLPFENTEYLRARREKSRDNAASQHEMLESF